MEYISEKIKNIRKQRGLKITELAQRAGVSKSYISQLEKGLIIPKIDTLKKVLDALGVSIIDFFSETLEKNIHFTWRDFIDFTPRSTRIKVILLTPVRERNFDIYYVELQSGIKTSTEDPHPGEEGGYVLKGELTIKLGGREIKVKRGESYSFKCNKTHYFKNDTDHALSFINIVCPPYKDVLIK